MAGALDADSVYKPMSVMAPNRSWNQQQSSHGQALTAFFQANSRVKDYQAHSSKVHSVNWSCDGRRLACGSFDKTVSIFALDKDRMAKDHVFKGHGDSVDQLCWHPSNPDHLATASLDKTVRLWDARTQKSIAVVGTKGENINICWSPDGQTIAVGNKEDLVSFIDVRSHKVRTDQQFKFEVNEISWNNTNTHFFLTSGQGCIHILSYPDLQLQTVLNAHPANCICIEFDPTGKYFATGSVDALVSLWDVQELACLRTFSRLEWPVRTISFSHDGKMLASASEDLLIDIADVETGEKIFEVPCESPTFTIAWHPKRHLLAFACDDKGERDQDAGTVKLFGLPSSS
ncbi:THO complex subunit 3 [Dermacentor andersoni]|uniref:THO complex subunit 3 n=1 Tax=Dermacentor andersoni TaxID=34620 RepID=UPI002155EEA3|nr:THO complex subunit 3-like [Dermacentor andersoni]